MSKKGIAIVALLLGAAGVGYAGYKYIYSDANSAGDLAGVIPADAYMAAYISNEPEAWEKLKKFGTPEAQRIITAQLNDVQQSFLKETKMDFNKDIQPWVGNTMVAVLPGTKAAKSDKPQILIAIGVKDKIKALEFANKLKSQSKDEVKTFNYQGVDIIDSGKGSGETFSAIVNDQVVVAPEKHTIELAIDTSKGQPSLASTAGNDWFKANTLGLQNPIAAFYVPNYGGAIKDMLKSSKTSPQLDKVTMAQLEKIKALGGGIAIDDAGIRMKFVAKTDGTIVQLPNIAGKPSSSFPADSLALFGGTGLKQIWTEANKIAASDPALQQNLSQVRQGFTQSTKLDLDKDVFGWMGGDYALGLMPVSTGMAASVGFGGALTIDATEPDTAKNTMTKLVDLAKQSGLSVSERQVGSAKVSDVKAPQGTLFSYGWLSDKSLAISVGDGLMEKIAAPSGETLDRSNDFTTALGSTSSKQSYGYINLEKAYALFNSKAGALGGRAIPADVSAFMNSVKGLGMSSTQPDSTTSQFEALLTLKPTNESK